MDAKAHWEMVHRVNAPDAVSWYRPHLETSLALINHCGDVHSASIIDVGGGQSTLVDDLVAKGCRNLTVLDISEAALEETKKRLGENAHHIRWIAGEVAQVELPSHAYDIWHDRAAFHFLNSEEQREAYIKQAIGAIKPGGHLILATFALNGPARCSGLEVVRYSAVSLAQELGEHFRLIESVEELHRTPNVTEQPFIYARFQAIG